MYITSHIGPARSAALIASIILLFLASTTVPAQGPTQRIRFKTGHASSTIKGTLVNTRRVNEAWRDYVLEVRKGQTITIRMSSPGNRVRFELRFPNGELAEDINGSHEHTFWTSELPASGDCQIQVINGAGRKPTTYSMMVEVR